MHRLLLLAVALATLSCGDAAAQGGAGRLHVGITILEPLSTDRSGPATVRRSRNALEVALPAAAAVKPVATVTVESGGRVAECRTRPDPGGAPRQGMQLSTCPLPPVGEPARIRMVLVPAA